MHSKVIVASLACVMAASFANGRVLNASVAKAPQLKTQEISCCSAPNEEAVSIGFNEDKIVYTSGNPFRLAFGIYGTYPVAQDFSVLSDPYGLFDRFFYYSNGQLGAEVNFPSSHPGEAYVSFGAHGKELCRMYIHTNGSFSCASGNSYDDAKAKYFLWQVATSTEKNYYPNEGGQSITNNTGFNAVKHYGTYTYASNDITTTRSTTSGGFNTSLNVKLRVGYYKNGAANPVNGIKLALYLDGVQIRPSTIKRTNSNGEYSITLNQNDGYAFKKLGSLQFAIYADNQATYVEDNNGFNYPYLYSVSSSTYLFSLKSVTYNVNIYPERSDRAAAYEITQAQSMIRGYINSFNNSGLTTNIKTNYPAYHTTYNSAENHYVSSIDVRKNHYACWDVLNHEYAHYACEVLNLCNTACDEYHEYDENLEDSQGYSYGSKMAYSEGLATFIALAGQVKCAIYGSGYITQIADYAYEDSVNGIYFDCYETQYGEPYNEHDVCVEASVASILVKLLCSSSHFGETQVWNAIRNVGGDNTTLVGLLDEFLRANRAYENEILGIIEDEGLLDQFESLSTHAPTAEWTIMLYMCASNLPTGRTLDKIRSVANQPANVNIIAEVGGYFNSTRIDRYHLRNGQWISDGYFYSSSFHMGDESTFEDFLFWGFENYPARKTGIIIWNHGHGVNGICADPNDIIGYNECGEIYDQLLVSETTTAFNNAFNYFGLSKLEFIGYDACLMQVQDVADFNSDFFKYMVASEEEEVDYMWVYDEWIDNVYAGDNTETILKEVVDSFVFDNDRYEYTWEQTLSVLDLSKMATYRQMFEGLAQEAIDYIFNNSSLSNSQVWEYYTHFIDLASFGAHQYSTFLTNNEWPEYGTNDVYDFLTAVMEDEYFGEALGETAYNIRYYLYPNKIMSSDPNVGENEDATFGPYARRTLVLYKRSSQVRLGQWACRSHGLAMHVWSERYQTYPAAETRFNKWRQLYFDYRFEIYNESYSY